MKLCMREYKTKLEKQIGELMKQPITERNASLVDSLVEKWEHLNEIELEVDSPLPHLTHDDISKWNRKMINSDGTRGGHWNVEQTKSLKESTGTHDISDDEWNVAMNMMYSDYGEVAKKYNLSTPQFYADLAHAFIFDEDSADNKLSSYYFAIVK